MSKTLIGIGNAIIDGVVEVSSDDALRTLGLVKGSCVFAGDGDDRFDTLSRLFPDYQADAGGAAANALCAYAALGGGARFVGKTGYDDHGRFFTESMARYDIAFDTVPTRQSQSSFLFAVITPDRERSFLSNHGASHYIAPGDIDEDWFSPQSSLIIDGYMLMSDGGPEALSHAMACATRKGAETIFMPCSLHVILEKRALVDDITARADMIICNEDEALALNGSRDFANLARLFKRGVVTLGERGAWYFSDNGQEGIIPPPHKPARIVNTNGAGDNFAGGFLYGLYHGMDMPSAVTLGQMCALHVIAKSSARCDHDLRHFIEAARHAG